MAFASASALPKKGANRSRPDRSLSAKPADSIGRAAGLRRDEFDGGQLTIASLASPHTGARQRLHPIGLAATETRTLAYGSGIHVFATADDRVVWECPHHRGRPGKGASQTTRKALEPRELAQVGAAGGR